jgi:hypothetical protein
MTATLGVSVRERWRSRELMIQRWLKRPGDLCRHGDVVAELRVEGVLRPFEYTPRIDADPEVILSFLHQQEGAEVGPWGELCQYTWLRTARGHAENNEYPTFVRRERYPDIFISYRRLEAEALAQFLYTRLAEHFGASEVFFDRVSIRPGEEFAWVLQQAVWHSSIFLAVLGPNWQKAVRGERDFTTREIVGALDTGSIIIPVLLPDTAFSDQLTNIYDVTRFTRHQAFQMSHEQATWDAQVAMLIETIVNARRDKQLNASGASP